MDLWSDPNLMPFMAITAHWIETMTTQTTDSLQYKLKLQASLIGFRQMPDNHNGTHLAHGFLSVIDRLNIAYKVSTQF